jgi:hypothetical protein
MLWVDSAGQLHAAVDHQDAAVHGDGGELLATLDGELALIGGLEHHPAGHLERLTRPPGQVLPGDVQEVAVLGLRQLPGALGRDAPQQPVSNGEGSQIVVSHDPPLSRRCSRIVIPPYVVSAMRVTAAAHPPRYRLV